jgi:diketogulonate reductase-like aldo/keto reductase
MEGQPGCGRGAVEQVAAVKGATAAQVALAWLLARGPSIVPIFGTRRLDRVKENLGAADVSLSDEDMAAIEGRLAQIEVTGERLPPALLKVTYRCGHPLVTTSVKTGAAGRLRV